MNRTSATSIVNTNAANTNGPAMNRVANWRWRGQRATAKMVGQTRDGGKVEAVHNASARRISASTALAFMRAPGPSGSGFYVSVRAATKRGSPAFNFFAPAFGVHAIGGAAVWRG